MCGLGAEVDDEEIYFEEYLVNVGKWGKYFPRQ